MSVHLNYSLKMQTHNYDHFNAEIYVVINLQLQFSNEVKFNRMLPSLPSLLGVLACPES